jgi:hypothetical protein
VAVDGLPGSGADTLADDLVGPLFGLGREPLRVRAEDFLRAASMRLERARDDPDAYYDDRHDLGALRREVLDPLGPDGSRRWLPSRWDPVTDRSTRAPRRTASPAAVLLLDGPFLLRPPLLECFEVTVHIALGPAARRRRVPAADAHLVLAAAERYDAECDPARGATFVVRADDPRHPALMVRG